MDAIHSGHLADAPTTTEPFFNLAMITECPNVPSEILIPKQTWPNAEAYDQTATKLTDLFRENFKSYADGVSDVVRNVLPT